MTKKRESVHGTWASRWTFILAAAGSAVGLGNIWKFPYIAGENGGGAFVLVYLGCIALVGVPVMMAEILVGRRGRQSPINTMRTVAKEEGASRAWVGIGWMGAAAGFLILSFYSVIAGWALSYVYRMLKGDFVGQTNEAVGGIFESLLASPVELTFWHTLFMVLTVFIVARGVNKGIEVAIRVLMPSLFVLLGILLMYGLTSGSFWEGFDFLFSFDTSKLTSEGVMIALGHAFFTLSLGMGAIMVYGAYMPSEASIGKTTVWVAFLDTTVALVAGLAIFPIVFANGLNPGAGPGLMFVTLPMAFGQMTGGPIFGTLFFVLVVFAAWSSSISLLEPVVAWLEEKKGVSRVTSAVSLGALIWLLGLGTVLSFNVWADYKAFGMTFFDLLDFVTANIMLPLGGLLIAVFVGWIMKERDVREEATVSVGAFSLWWTVLRFVAPVAIFFVFAHDLIGKFVNG